jgi:hypothetical protein
MSGRTVVGTNTSAAAAGQQQSGSSSSGTAWRVAVAVVVPVLVVTLLAWLVGDSCTTYMVALCVCLTRLSRAWQLVHSLRWLLSAACLHFAVAGSMQLPRCFYMDSYSMRNSMLLLLLLAQCR